MIGDWVEIQDTPKYYKVEGVNIFARGDACRLTFEDYVVDTWCDRVKPIPLTPEILEANGFETNDHNNGFVDKLYTTHVDEGKSKKGVGKAKIGVRRIRVTFYTDINKVNHIFCRVAGVSKRVIEGEIYFVHELQHALRFCGLDEIADNFKVES